MADFVVKFCCKNCKHLNRIQRSQVDEAIKIGNKPVGVCGHCGMVNQFIDPSLANKEDSKPLICVPFVDTWPTRLPAGSLPGGMFADAFGKSLNEVDFMMQHGVNPRINLAYRKAGLPEPKEKCP
jgi:hypothetical protein